MARDTGPHGRAIAAPPRQQRGAIGLFAALTLLLTLLFAALAVDAGRLFFEQRSLQRIADTVALDTAMRHGLCGVGDIGDAAAWAQDAALRNGYRGDLAAEPDAVQLGWVETVDGLRTFRDGGGLRNEAVRIHGRNPVRASLFAGGLLGDTVTLNAVAVAERQPVATIFGGTKLANISSEESVLLNLLLNELLGSNLNLDAVAYNGLANTNLTLLELMQGFAVLGLDLAVATVDEMLNMQVTLAELLEATVSALDHADVLDVDVGLLESQLLGAGIRDVELTLGELLELTAPAGAAHDAALHAGVNVLDLIRATALTANRDHAITVNLGIPLNLGLLNTDIVVDIHVIEAPKIAIGPPGRDGSGEWRTKVDTAQVRVQLTTSAGVNVLGLLTADVDLPLAIEVADGEAWFQSARCATLGDPSREAVLGVDPGIASVTLGRWQDLATGGEVLEPAEVVLRAILLGDVVRLGLALDLPLREAVPREVVFTQQPGGEWEGEDAVYSGLGPSLGDGLSNTLVAVDPEVLGLNPLALLGINLDDVLGALLGGLLAPLLQTLGDTLLDPLLRLLGISVGGMDVDLLDMREGGVDLLI
ncbi:putative transmembrane protein [Thioalkalivibrio nitratireducens DSM 14787]|uniref:Transmembrane protein n=1 Tax=Thioalkalivibrio nitratireducens (strain DSM 14787 / UNIQEM 213 / ALEN2) TaxID=1255043 RepID=L0DYK8_THIND|nr:TadG family pilus assembly protein [Thioalkalivibrio nitratireducens]AGA34138.1 putative transmembrane protein [Thioalkalivibrio nitratireducens DSM 14787]